MQTTLLPFVDEHATTVAAGVDAVWATLLEAVDGALSTRGSAAYARLVGCADRTVSGPRPLVAGSTLPGFRVVAAVPERELALEGRHRFSTYALTFRIEAAGPMRSVLRAESRAAFPGLLGRAYRLAVIGTGGHVVAVRRFLRGVQRRAERR